MAGAVLVILVIFNTEPEAKKEQATKKTAMLVSVSPVETGTFTPTFSATGTVEAARDITLSSQVSGVVTRVSSSFIPGSYVGKGEKLIAIQQLDYQNILELRKSELEQAQADLEIEMGRQKVAQQELELIGDTLSNNSQELVLRKPQLDAIKSRVKAAQASVNQAELNLRRTSIDAPFDAQVISRNINVGSQVGVGENLGRMVGVDEYWVRASLRLANLPWLSFPEEGGPGSPVTIRNRTAWPDSIYRHGMLYRLIGALDNQTRLASVLIQVPDPLNYESKDSELPKLLIGSFVEVKIQANAIRDVARLDRQYLRRNETVWVMEKGKLSIRQVEIAIKDEQYAYIASGLEQGEMVVTSSLATISEGVNLRTDSDSTVNANTTPLKD